MKNDNDLAKPSTSPKFAKTAREWILASALYDGIEDEDIRQIEMLVSERGANPNVLLPEYGISPFHFVVANESTRFAVQATDLCLQHGADPNVRSEDGLTPVHLAAMWGCSEVLHLLLASGGNPWLVDDLGLNAFDYAEREGQRRCYQMLKACCNSQPKQSGYRKSPFKLNLKRVILYKNDLQIVYEASPTSGQKSTSTQTSPKALSKIGFEALSDNCSQKSSPSKKEHKAIANGLIINTKDENSHCIKNNETPVTSKLKDIIEKHRRNSVLFEYSPDKGERQNISSGVDSWRDPDQSDLVQAGFSELVSKLDETNKIRQSLKASDNNSDLLKNITQRKIPCATPKPFEAPKYSASLVSDSSYTSCDKSCQYEVPHEIGFILDDTKANSTVIEDSSNKLEESPPSIGFILDNLSDVCNGQDGSLFSDIASDVEAFTTPVHNDSAENIMTEDEQPLDDNVLTVNSSSGSLHPYVSCENTRERESTEEFASCRNSDSCLEGIKNKQQPPAIVDVLNDYFKKHERTPPNPDVITSTPEKSESNSDSDSDYIEENAEDSQTKEVDLEMVTTINVIIKSPKRLYAGSDDSSFSTPTVKENDQYIKENSQNNKQNDQNEKSDEKLSWVVATVASSSDEDPYLSISEEYQYTDLDEGVVLIEKRYLNKDISMSAVDSEKKVMPRESSSSECESVSTLSGSEGAYDTDELRRALVQHGFVPGPITGNTKRVYLRKLKRCGRKPQPPPPADTPAFSPELLRTLAKPCEHLLAEWSHLEDSMSTSFSCPRRPWREGQAKTSFTYLLLDPRVAYCLPSRATAAPDASHALWGEFLRGVFYVGKGKRSRPYAHLYQAVSAWQQNKETRISKKIQRILDIWKAGEGVICLHVFLNVIPVEALTREAAMICAMTLPQLTNEQVGKFYGSAASWSERLRRRLGCVLLHRAFKVYLAEGERQLRPADID